MLKHLVLPLAGVTFALATVYLILGQYIIPAIDKINTTFPS